MKKITLKRDFQDERVTLGRLSSDDGELLLESLELPWLGNKPMESCIPAGDYLCRRSYYNRGGYDAYEITAVPNRTHILIHVANYPRDVVGCVGVGKSRDVQVPAVWRSKVAFSEFMAYLNGDVEFHLTIENAHDGTDD